MRYESSITSVSWIPSEAMTGIMKLPMAIGVSHYDDPPPDHIDDLDALRAADRFRFANKLRAWIEVDDGQIVDAGYSGSGHIGATTLNLGVGSVTIPAVAFPDLQTDPVIENGSVRFVQTAGGRTGAPMPRTVHRKSLVRITPPTAWTTLELIIRIDGTSDGRMTGASPFPRHWVYDESQNLVAKSGIVDFREWSKKHFGDNTPWGDSDSPALVAEVETALERELSLRIMREGTKPSIVSVPKGSILLEQGTPGDELILVLDGLFEIEVDGSAVAQVGPGAVLGERALLEGGSRTSTVTSVTKAKIAVVQTTDIDREVLGELAEGHRREDD